MTEVSGARAAGRSRSVERVAAALRAAGVTATVTTVAEGARTAADAARSIGCSVDQIAKSIVLRPEDGHPPVVVVARGGRRVDVGKVAAHLGVAVIQADPAYVRERTGFAVGGVAPVGHTGPATVLLDAGLLALPEVWAAAGAPHAVVRLTPEELVRLTGAPPVDVTDP